ncbi:MAG: redoxin domain-containing protein [Tepidisphaeraceae bacterium]
MSEPRRKIHGGLLMAAGLFGVSLSVLILGASRGQSKNAGLPDSPAAEFALRDTAGVAHRLSDWRDKPVVLIVAPKQAADFAKSAGEVNQIRDTFARDDSIQIVGVQVTNDSGLFAGADNLPGVLETKCPGMMVLQDTGANISASYRTPDAPTAFVIDGKGVIRARVALDHEGAAVTIAGTVSSLRPVQPRLDNLR